MESSVEIAGIVLAAGFSSRMGEFKPLLPLGSSTVLERAVASLRRGGVADVVVVTGHGADGLRPYVARLGCREAVNRKPELGMFSSVLVGVDALTDPTTAAFVLPVDVPLVSPDTIRALALAYLDTRAGVVFPCCGGRRGHPPLVARACFAPPLPPAQAGGLAALLARRSDAIDLPVPDEAVLWDVDTPEEYERMVAHVGREPASTADGRP